MNNDIIKSVCDELQQNIDEAVKQSAGNFFKEPVSVRGIKTAIVSRIAAHYFKQIRQLAKPDIFALCEILLESDYMEDAFVAFDWAYRLHSAYEPDDFVVFERWLVKYVNNWAKCDTLCNHTIGSFVEQFPQYIVNLKGWTRSDNRWLRRAAAVTLVLPARRGKFLPDIFEIADILLSDRDDLVQKGCGWMLKEASKPHQNEIFQYVIGNKQIMPRTMLRYAIEKMPPGLRAQAMAK